MQFLPKDKTYRVTIDDYDPDKEEEEVRTKKQNAYYHVLLDIICKHTGDDHMDLHDYLKYKFLSRPYVCRDGEAIIVGSTRSLTIEGFGEYLEKVFKFASEYYELVLPNPSY